MFRISVHFGTQRNIHNKVQCQIVLCAVRESLFEILSTNDIINQEKNSVFFFFYKYRTISERKKLLSVVGRGILLVNFFLSRFSVTVDSGSINLKLGQCTQQCMTSYTNSKQLSNSGCNRMCQIGGKKVNGLICKRQ